MDMRAVALIVLAGLLGGCAGDQSAFNAAGPAPAGDWKIDRRIDRISGAPAPTGLLYTRATNTKVQFAQPALLQLMCFDRAPIVRFAFEFRVGANRSATVQYRFDQKPGRDANVRFLVGSKTFVIEEPGDVAAFADELAASTTLFVRVTSLVSGRTAAEFNIQGASPVIEAAYTPCPLPSRSASLKRGQADAR
jgi:hypothetical protein